MFTYMMVYLLRERYKVCNMIKLVSKLLSPLQVDAYITENIGKHLAQYFEVSFYNVITTFPAVKQSKQIV